MICVCCCCCIFVIVIITYTQSLGRSLCHRHRFNAIYLMRFYFILSTSSIFILSFRFIFHSNHSRHTKDQNAINCINLYQFWKMSSKTEYQKWILDLDARSMRIFINHNSQLSVSIFSFQFVFRSFYKYRLLVEAFNWIYKYVSAHNRR